MLRITARIMRGICAIAERGDAAPMPKRVEKADLPQKVCAACGRPFAWRKKWEKVWDEVRYCSERCRRARAEREPMKPDRSATLYDAP